MVWYDVGPPFVGKTASTLLARYSTSLAVFMGILHHFFFRKSIGDVRLACWMRGPGLQTLLEFIPKVFSLGLRSEFCAGQWSSSTPKLLIHVFMDLYFLHWWKVLSEQEGVIHKVFSQSCKHEVAQNVLVCWSNSSFTGTKGPSPATENQHHTLIPRLPNFTSGTMQQISTVVLATPKPRLANWITR